VRLAIIVDAYPPFRSSAAIQIRDLAQEFALQGHEVIVITPAAGQVDSWKEEFSYGVRVLRLAAPQTKNIGRIRRAAAEILLPFFMALNFKKSPAANLRLDGIIWYSPTIFFGPLVHILKHINRCSSYLILRDIFPDFAVDIGLLKRGLIYRFFKLFEFYQYSLAGTIGVQSESNISYLWQWAKTNNHNLEVLHNWLAVSPNVGTSFSVAASPLSGKKVFVYAGNMGVMQGIDTVLDLAERVLPLTDVGFLLVGRGSEVARLKKEASRRQLKNVVFHDEVDPSEIPAVLAQCHTGLILLDHRHTTHNIPGKLLAYMQAGLPVLARINPGNDLAILIQDNGIGHVYTGESLDIFQELAEEIMNNDSRREEMATRARAIVTERFLPSQACAQIVVALSN